jgi:hypothetical protein
VDHQPQDTSSRAKGKVERNREKVGELERISLKEERFSLKKRDSL